MQERPSRQPNSVSWQVKGLGGGRGLGGGGFLTGLGLAGVVVTSLGAIKQLVNAFIG